MAVFAGLDMKKWRESQNVSAADLAERISCDVTTIYRYESGKIRPDPDVMYEICDALGDVDKWTTWMRTSYPLSYARVHPETVQNTLQGALMKMYAELQDVIDMQREVLKDGSDGSIDNRILAEQIETEVTEVIQSAQRVRSLMQSRMKGGE